MTKFLFLFLILVQSFRGLVRIYILESIAINSPNGDLNFISQLLGERGEYFRQ